MPARPVTRVKAFRFMLPLLALTAAAVWLSSQQRQLGQLSRSNHLLRERIALEQSRLAHDRENTSLPRRQDRTPQDNHKSTTHSWQQIAERLASARVQSDAQSLREQLWLQKRAMEMSADELLAALDELASVEMNAEVRRMIEDSLLGALENKDPARLLERFREKFADVDGMRAWQLGNAFDKWLAKEPAAATAWLDGLLAADELASKSLDGKHPLRSRFEAAMLNRLVAVDPAAAAARIAAVPPNQRRDVFQQAWGNLEPGTEKALAGIARSQVPAADMRAMLEAGASLNFHQGGLAKVSEFLDQIDAPAGEREWAASRAAQERLRTLGEQNELNRGAIDSLHDWLAKETPQRADALTGQALGNVAESNYRQASEWVTALHGESGNDELLLSFLAAPPAARHRDESLALAARITDPALREQTIARIRQSAPP